MDQPSTNTQHAEQADLHTNKTILVLDDDPDVLESTCGVLDRLGYSSVPFEDAANVPQAALERQPLAILLDLRIPGVNVPGLVAALRSDPNTSSIPIVFFSANPDIAHTASRYGAWGFLAKPFTSNQLGQLLQRAAERRDRGDRPENVAAKREARSSFHDYWNTLGALSNYAYLFRQDPKLDEEEQRRAKKMEDLVLLLQSQTERLQRYILAMIG